MTKDQFQDLLADVERNCLDYKQQSYDFRTDRHKFVKDVLSMANTPREGSAYLVFGVTDPSRGPVEVVGLDVQKDDAHYQDQFPLEIQPRPQFTYFPMRYDGKDVGVLEIPVAMDGPFTSITDTCLVKHTHKILKGAVYYRRGTQNAHAAGPELRRIHAWFLTGEDNNTDAWDTHSWRSLTDILGDFRSRCTYILVADVLRFSSDVPLHTIGLHPWRAAVDFDPESELHGLLSRVGPSLKSHRHLHLDVSSKAPVSPEPATHWFFARGLSGRRDSVHVGDYVNWVRSHKRRLSERLETVAAAISPSAVVAVVLWPTEDSNTYLSAVINELHASFMSSIEVVVIAESPGNRQSVEANGATFVHMRFKELCHGLAALPSNRSESEGTVPSLPSTSGAPIELPADDRIWLSEDLELLYLGSGKTADGDDARAYRTGADIRWRNLLLRHDCERDLTQAVARQVQEDLRARQTTRLNLYHAPGAGGTTVARRVAWDMHETFPVCVLRTANSESTAEKIGIVSISTGQSVLVLVDGGSHTERDIDDLYEQLKARHTPAVLLQVLRRFDKQRAGKRQFWLDEGLSDTEATRFFEAYAHAAPEKQGALASLSRDRGRSRSPFFFGLIAFEDDYHGLDAYVAARLPVLSNTQRNILLYIAVSYYYGQQAVPAHAFAFVLGLPMSKTINFRNAFAGTSSHALQLLVETELAEWRTSHQLIALQILRRQLGPRGATAQSEDMWKQELSSCARAFINFCRPPEQPESDLLVELARRVFIYRDNVEVLGTERASQRRYSQLIEDIPSPQGKVGVLEFLTERFPEEAHFHAHLARLLSQIGEHSRALGCADSAIEMQPKDPVLHHMRGMVLREEMRRTVDRKALVQDVIPLAKLAAQSFGEARALRPDREHSYVSEAQMLINLVDYAGRGKGDVVEDVLTKPGVDPFLRDALQNADDLLDQVRDLYGGERPSRYVQDCRARLATFYGNFERALQAWNNLLSRQDVWRPPVRKQIVWTLLRRRKEDWSHLGRTELRRIQGLLEENLQDDPNDSTSLRLWLRAIRLAETPVSLDRVIERVSYWKANTSSWDASYYLYVLHTLRALDGSTQGQVDAERALEECRSLTMFRRDRTRSFEWLGRGNGVNGLVHQSRLGDWDGDFWADAATLERVPGRVKSIDGPQKGTVEVRGAVDAFFVPARAGLFGGRDENVSVDCHLGFSYDGPRAWNVKACR